MSCPSATGRWSAEYPQWRPCFCTQFAKDPCASQHLALKASAARCRALSRDARPLKAASSRGSWHPQLSAPCTQTSVLAGHGLGLPPSSFLCGRRHPRRFPGYSPAPASGHVTVWANSHCSQSDIWPESSWVPCPPCSEVSANHGSLPTRGISQHRLWESPLDTCKQVMVRNGLVIKISDQLGSGESRGHFPSWPRPGGHRPSGADGGTGRPQASTGTAPGVGGPGRVSGQGQGGPAVHAGVLEEAAVLRGPAHGVTPPFRRPALTWACFSPAGRLASLASGGQGAGQAAQ